MNEEKTSQAVLEAVSGLNTTVSVLHNSVSGLSTTVSGLQKSVSGLEKTVSVLRETVSGVEHQVTELGESVFELRDAMMAFSDRTDRQFNVLTDVLRKNGVITKYEASQVKNASALPA